MLFIAGEGDFLRGPKINTFWSPRESHPIRKSPCRGGDAPRPEHLHTFPEMILDVSLAFFSRKSYQGFCITMIDVIVIQNPWVYTQFYGSFLTRQTPYLHQVSLLDIIKCSVGNSSECLIRSKTWIILVLPAVIAPPPVKEKLGMMFQGYQYSFAFWYR